MAKRTKRESPVENDEPIAAQVIWQGVFVPRIVRLEARSFLTLAQYVHVTDFVKQLSGFGSRRYDPTLRIEPIGDYWELKEKGGVLGKINVRIYFAHVAAHNRVVLLSAYKKEVDGAAPPHILLRLKHRLRSYHNGELDDDALVYIHEDDS